MNAVEHYSSRIDAVEAQQVRLGRDVPDRWSRCASIFRSDPHRPQDETLSALAGYVLPDDVLIDVGGGAGRLGLPMALRCRELVNVEPAGGMQDLFAEVAAEAGITNARRIQSDWLTAPHIEGDMTLAAHVTYFVRDIEPFLRRFNAAARRRAILLIASVPPPNLNATVFRLVNGEAQEPVPGHRELLPVLWEMGILPEIIMLRQPPRPADRPNPDRSAAIQAGAGSAFLAGDEHALAVIDEHFDTLFRATPEGYLPSWAPESRTMLITWETNNSVG